MRTYTTTIQEQLAAFDTNPDIGLRARQVVEQRERYGENRLREAPRPGLLRRFLRQLNDVMIWILLAAAAISFVLALLEDGGEGFLDPIIILLIVVLNGVLGVVQESRAQNALDALKQMSAPAARVLRDGAPGIIPAAELVPGDIIELAAGDFVPADARLLEAASLQCEESALTGESEPAEKSANALVEPEAPLGERRNMLYSGCAVTAGRAVAVVTATGMNTELGKIAAMLESAGEEPTPLQQRLARLGKYLGLLALVVCALVFITGLLRGMGAMEMLLTSVSLAVAVIPEGMTAVVTVVLALGVQRMAKQGAIIRRLPAVETLGSASVICSDKTGTLTQNRMSVRTVWPVGERMQDPADSPDDAALQLLRLGTLCCDGRVELQGGEAVHIGDPTETAIVAAALSAGMGKAALESEFPRVAELPFDSERKRMTTVHQIGRKFVAITKGGFDVVLPLCPDADGTRAAAVNRAMAQDALRVLAVACREWDDLPERLDISTLETGLHLMGLIGMIDPPREEAAESVALCHSAGIRTVMITGDHALTAGAIARELGMLSDGARVMEGSELQTLSDTELAQTVPDVAVYARVSPEDKLRIVRAWQQDGAVVAMTGDGVNDAPALRTADIGCAMGVTGTDVAKGAADMVLTDDNFATIVHAVREGRGIYDNIRKTVQFLLSCNLGEVITVFFAILFGWSAPLLAIHLLLINVVTDALPALALGLEPVDDSIMRRKPIPSGQGLFAGGLGLAVLLQGIMIGALTLVAYYVGQTVALSLFVPASHEVGMTMAFLTLCLGQLTQALNCRSERSLLRIGVFSSPRMTQAVLLSALSVLLLCSVTPLQRLFHLTDLSMLHWLLVLALSLAPLVLVEMGKGFLALKRKIVL